MRGYSKSLLVCLGLCFALSSIAEPCTNFRILNRPETITRPYMPYLLSVEVGNCVSYYQYFGSTQTQFCTQQNGKQSCADTQLWMPTQTSVILFPHLQGSLGCVHGNFVKFTIWRRFTFQGSQPLVFAGSITYHFNPQATTVAQSKDVMKSNANVTVVGDPFDYIKLSYYRMQQCNMGSLRYQ